MHKDSISPGEARRRFEADILAPAARSRAIVAYRAARLRFRVLAHPPRWYQPDFLVVCGSIPAPIPHSRLCLVDVKAFLITEASSMVRDAAAKYPEFGWLMADLADVDGPWRAFPVTGLGITPNPVHVPWIHGG